MNKLPLHPYVLAVFSLLLFYSNNITYFDLSVIAVPIMQALVVVSILLALFLLLARNMTLASVMTTVVVFFFCSFSYAYQSACNLQMLALYAIHGSHNIPITPFNFMIVWVVLAFIVLGICWRNRNYLNDKQSLFNTIALCCLLVTVSDVSVREFARQKNVPAIAESLQQPLKSTKLANSGELPDIYYIILDGCARSDTLKTLYHYDNSKFVQYLTNKGFFLADASCSNYQMTVLSLGSSLNMNYINSVNKWLPENSKDWLPMITLIKNNLVAEKLRAIGYKYVIFNSDWANTKYVIFNSDWANTRGSSIADEVVSCGWHDDFQNWFLETTLWPFIESELHILRNEAYAHWLVTFDKADSLEHIASPKFVFLHFILPHPPYLFSADGQQIESGPSVMRLEEFANRHAYVEQVKFTEKKIEQLVDGILASSKQKPVIILQADHGPASLDFREVIDDPHPAFLRERMSIFNAYYFPDGQYSQLYESISPVNSFRVVLNKYCQAGIPLLPDKSYFSDYATPYKFLEVTKKINANAQLD